MPLPDEVADYEIDLPYELIHDLIAESDLYFGEGATMASEAAVLGVPSIFISTLRLGYLDELQQKYGLVYSHSNRDEAMTQVRELLTDKTTAGEWKSRREKMLKEKIDVSKFISDIVMNFPKSIDKYRL
jgi:predicted glycosyltransferase